MRRRFLSLLCGVPLIVGLVVVATPAYSASTSLTIQSAYAAVDDNGRARIKAYCSSSSTCTGTLRVDDGVSPALAYSVTAKGWRYISMGFAPTSTLNPLANRTKSDGDPTKRGAQLGEIYRVPDVKIVIAEKKPGSVSHVDTIHAETRLPGLVQQLRGSIVGMPGSQPVTEMKVRLVEKLRGGAEKVVATRDVVMAPSNGGYRGRYVFDVPVDVNNWDGTWYYLKVEGRDPHGAPRSWWWRGSDGSNAGGSRYSRDATGFRLTRYRDFNADFTYGFLEGRVLAPAEFNEAGAPTYVKAGVDVSVAAPPPAAYASATAMQELDIVRCANVFARVKTNAGGIYRVDFLPLGPSDRNENRYMVGARSGGAEVWTGSNASNGARRYGSCYDATSYTGSTANLIALPHTSPVNLALTEPTETLSINQSTPKYSPSLKNDRWVTIRERIPGLTILDSPVVAEGFEGTYEVPQGSYTVEMGRRLACSTWYRSVYPNNYAYHKGADRGAERWKTVAGAAAEYQKSYDMGYQKADPGNGYKGWMYRDHCKTLSAGTINTVVVGVNSVTSVTTTAASRGGVVYGTVKRVMGRTNKEMMVRLSSTNGTTVVRTDLTDSRGKFYVAGLASGTYTISVNSDSWRGIGRSFSGLHRITVKVGNNHNAGTLTFNG